MGSSWEKGVREEEQGKWNNPVDTKVSEGGLIGAPGTLWNSWRRPWLLPRRTWKNTSEDIHTAACGGPHTRAGGNALKETLACGKPTQAAGLICIPYEGSNIRALEKCEEEDMAERKCCGLIATPISSSSCSAWGERGVEAWVMNKGAKFSLGRREGVISSVFVCQHPALFLYNLIFLKSRLFLPMMVIGKWAPCPFIEQ